MFSHIMVGVTDFERALAFYKPVLDALGEVSDILAATAEPSRYRMTPLTTLPLYLGFADNPRGRALAELYDRRMALLQAEGRLREVFARWQQPYPFD